MCMRLYKIFCFSKPLHHLMHFRCASLFVEIMVIRGMFVLLKIGRNPVLLRILVNIDQQLCAIRFGINQFAFERRLEQSAGPATQFIESLRISAEKTSQLLAYNMFRLMQFRTRKTCNSLLAEEVVQVLFVANLNHEMKMVSHHAPSIRLDYRLQMKPVSIEKIAMVFIIHKQFFTSNASVVHVVEVIWTKGIVFILHSNSVERIKLLIF